MIHLNRESALKWLLVILSLVPAALFAYLGSFSRIVSDDLMHLSIGRELGPLGSMLHWRITANGSYSFYFLHGLLAPVDIQSASVVPTVIIALAMLGLVLLHLHFLSFLRLKGDPLASAAICSALITAAAINAFHTPQSIYWYTASTRYTLPVAVLTVCLALVVSGATRLRGWIGVALALAVICFVNAGLSAMYLVFQFVCLSLLLFFSFLFIDRRLRRAYIVLIGAGWVGTIASVVTQLSAPGVALRMRMSEESWANPIRTIPELLTGTTELTFEYIGRQEAFAGFVILLALGIVLTVRSNRAVLTVSNHDLITITPAPLLLTLAVQLCLAPILWTHLSDLPQVLGRFSNAFATVVALNATLIIALVVLTWRRQSFTRLLKRQRDGWRVNCGVLLALFFLLFVLTQLRSIHYKAATYLFVTAMTLLGVLCWQLAHTVSEPRVTRMGQLSLAWILMTVIVIAVQVMLSLYVHGAVTVRIMSGVAFLQVSGGLIWGSLLGTLISHTCIRTEAGRAWTTWVCRFSLGLLAVICVGIVFGHGRSISELSIFADEWDARHQMIMSAIDSNQEDVAVPPLNFPVDKYFCCSNYRSHLHAMDYYGRLSAARNEVRD